MSEADVMQALGELVDGPPYLDPWDDDQARMRIYAEALRDPSLRPDLDDALREDPDPNLVSEVLVLWAAELDGAQRRNLLDVLPATAPRRLRSQVARRLDELEVLESDRGGGLTSELMDAARAGSDWLQRALAEQSQRAEVLGVLAAGGQTRRVRTTAAFRLRHLAVRPSRRSPPAT